MLDGEEARHCIVGLTCDEMSQRWNPRFQQESMNRYSLVANLQPSVTAQRQLFKVAVPLEDGQRHLNGNATIPLDVKIGRLFILVQRGLLDVDRMGDRKLGSLSEYWQNIEQVFTESFAGDNDWCGNGV
jgi:hypothetical protein